MTKYLDLLGFPIPCIGSLGASLGVHYHLESLSRPPGQNGLMNGVSIPKWRHREGSVSSSAIL